MALDQKSEREKAIAQKLLPFLEGKKHIGIYMADKGEVDPLAMLEGMPVCLYAPVVLKKRQMEFRVLENLKLSAFGILEPDTSHRIDPQDLDVILVPMVGFCHLHRMGHGAGYYDRYLPKTRALKIGLAFDVQQADFQTAPWDVDMDVVITETTCIQKGGQ